MFIPDRRFSSRTPDRPSRLSTTLERIYIAYGRRLIRRSFANVHVSHATPSAGTSWAAAGDTPSIAFINHSAWWDAVIPFVVSHDLFRRVSYAIMEGEQLLRYPFFRRLGCYGATTNSLADARRIHEYSVQVLRHGTRRTLWLAPQGALLAARTPIRFRSGLARISKAVPAAALVPVALRFEFRNQRLPECYMRVGDPVPPVSADEPIHLATARLCDALVREVAALDATLLVAPESPDVQGRIRRALPPG